MLPFFRLAGLAAILLTAGLGHAQVPEPAPQVEAQQPQPQPTPPPVETTPEDLAPIPAEPPLTPEEIARREKEAQQACAVCGGGLAAIGVFILAMVALNIALLVWVARDARARGMDSSALWMVLVGFTGLIGLIIYVCSRPQGELVQCPHCKGKRLAVSAVCPICRNP